MYNENYLAHYGIKGMHWGVRRTEKQLGGKPSLLSSWKQKSDAKKAAEAAKPKPKPVSEMSDTELKERLNRLDMEKRYMQYLADQNPKKDSMAKRVMLALS